MPRYNVFFHVFREHFRGFDAYGHSNQRWQCSAQSPVLAWGETRVAAERWKYVHPKVDAVTFLASGQRADGKIEHCLLHGRYHQVTSNLVNHHQIPTCCLGLAMSVNSYSTIPLTNYLGFILHNPTQTIVYFKLTLEGISIAVYPTTFFWCGCVQPDAVKPGLVNWSTEFTKTMTRKLQ